MSATIKPGMPGAIDTLARTAWAEARGDGQDGMTAVMNVICTRANNPRWWGNNIANVCLKPWQFSCWNANDPNRAKLMAVTDSDPQFALALNLAELAVECVLPDITKGADSYYAMSMLEPPAWATPDKFTAQVGSQRFYRVELPAIGTGTATLVG